MVVKKQKPGIAALRKLKNPLYDTEDLPADAAAVNNLTFFQTPIGGALPVAGTPKTYAETNLQQSGMLGEPNEFDVMGFQCTYNWDMDYKDIGTANETVANFIDDMTEVYEQSVFTWRYSNKEYLNVPLTRIPHGDFYLYGPADTQDDNGTGVGDTYFFISNGNPSRKEFYKFYVDGKPSRIRSMENFSAQISWPNAAVGLTAGGDESRMTVFVNGIYRVSL